MKNNLKVWRAKQDVTQAELAEAVDVSRQTINAIERGRYDPSLSLAFELADYFDCSVEDIFTYDPETE
ncbi:helix-turn-helix domain-containing protein [Halovenus sp. WSH3]|uniref:Helix-turn-helix domain-containing protein n=1 Tax=Halovenus carboxidivorans TaxID=2692199 RepID=A0A6B0T6U8_9EURY|nr:helix-turn-helix transcriptional regulator [Halovenus carboxidivorans]MXR51293.1 helix-turn-helix domain-containing protein [Halovenus carboxidivorans]